MSSTYSPINQILFLPCFITVFISLKCFYLVPTLAQEKPPRVKGSCCQSVINNLVIQIQSGIKCLRLSIRSYLMSSRLQVVNSFARSPLIQNMRRFSLCESQGGTTQAQAYLFLLFLLIKWRVLLPLGQKGQENATKSFSYKPTPIASRASDLSLGRAGTNSIYCAFSTPKGTAIKSLFVTQVSKVVVTVIFRPEQSIFDTFYQKCISALQQFSNIVLINEEQPFSGTQSLRYSVPLVPKNYKVDMVSSSAPLSIATICIQKLSLSLMKSWLLGFFFQNLLTIVETGLSILEILAYLQICLSKDLKFCQIGYRALVQHKVLLAYHAVQSKKFAGIFERSKSETQGSIRFFQWGIWMKAAPIS